MFSRYPMRWPSRLSPWPEEPGKRKWPHALAFLAEPEEEEASSPNINANAGAKSNNSEAGPSGAHATAAPITSKPKWHHRDPYDPTFEQQIVEASKLESPTQFNAMMEGVKKAAATLPAETPPPANRKKAKTAAGAIEISDTPPPSASTCTEHSTTSP